MRQSAHGYEASGRTRRLALSRSANAAIMLAIAGVALAAVTACGRGAAPAGPTSTATPGPTSTATPGPTSTATPGPTVQPSKGPTMDPKARADMAALANGRLDIPTWPGRPDGCPAGARQFSNGEAVAKEFPEAEDTRYVIHTDIAPVYGNLDGQPGDELLITVECRGEGSLHLGSLMALKPNGGKRFATLGFVIVAPDHAYLWYDADDVRVEGRTVLIEAMGPQASDGDPEFWAQVRGYRYDGGRFHQVSGPTSFPTPPKRFEDIDFRNATLILFPFDACDSCWYASVRFVNGSGDDTTVTSQAPMTHERFTYRIDQVSPVRLHNGTTGALLTVTRQGRHGEITQGVFAAEVKPVPMAWPVVTLGRDGIVAIVSQRGVGDVAEVTVRTSTGTETRRYRQNVNGQQWDPVT